MSRRRPLNDTPPRTRATKVRPREHPRPTPGRSGPAPKTAKPKVAKTRGAKPKPRTSRRGRGLFTRITLVLGLAVSTVALGGEWALHQSFLRVQHVRLVGLRHESPATVLVASGLDAHPAMIDVSSKSLEQRLHAFAWIRSVNVAKHWPDTLVVTVAERVPVAVAFDSQHVLRYVDGAGDNLGPAPLHVNLPTLTYLHAAKPTWPFRHAGRSAAFVASQLPRAFAAQVALVSEDAQGIVSLQLTTPVSFILGPPTNLKAKFVSIASVIAHSTLAAGDVVDVSVPGALAVTGPAIR